MSEIKKTVVCFFVALLFLGSAFYAGFRVSDSRAEVRIDKLAERACDIENKLAEQVNRNREITTELEQANSITGELTKQLSDVTEYNRQLIKSTNSIGSGTSEDIERLSSLYDRVSKYIGETEKTE